MQTLRQVEFSLVDMHLHYDYDPASKRSVQELINEVREKFSVMMPPVVQPLPALVRPYLCRRVRRRLL